jgi:ABC-type polysaccharide/polyol phosphate export permease
VRSLNKVTLQGITPGFIAGVITAIFMVVFHKSLPQEVVASLPFVVATVFHYFGVNFAINKAVVDVVTADPSLVAPSVKDITEEEIVDLNLNLDSLLGK